MAAVVSGQRCWRRSPRRVLNGGGGAAATSGRGPARAAASAAAAAAALVSRRRLVPAASLFLLLAGRLSALRGGCAPGGCSSASLVFPALVGTRAAATRPAAPELAAAAGGRLRTPLGAAATASPGTPPLKPLKSLKAAEYIKDEFDPKLKNLLATREYRRLLDVLLLLQAKGALSEFLVNCVDYWATVDLGDIILGDQERGRALAKAARREWVNLWPETLESNRAEAFDVFSSFSQRLSSSQLGIRVLEAVIPGTGDVFEDGDLYTLDDEARAEELNNRLSDCDLVIEYEVLTEGDADVQKLAPQVVPALQRIVYLAERKVFQQRQEMDSLDPAIAYVVAFICILGIIGILNVAGFVKLSNPFNDEVPPPPSQPLVTYTDEGGLKVSQRPAPDADTLAKLQAAAQAAAEEDRQFG